MSFGTLHCPSLNNYTIFNRYFIKFHLTTELIYFNDRWLEPDRAALSIAIRTPHLLLDVYLLGLFDFIVGLNTEVFNRCRVFCHVYQ